MSEQEAKVELLRNVDIFAKLREYELDIIAKYSEYIRVEKNEIIFQQGVLAQHLFIIEEGEVLISRQSDEGDMELARIIKGESFGELDLLEGSKRHATAYANVTTILLIFPRRGVEFKDIIKKHPDISALILYKFIGIISERIKNVNKLANEKTQWLHNLKKQLLSDKLTGMFNRTFMQEDFNKMLPEYKNKTGLIVVKPDNFKEINDHYGHEAGDNVLQVMAIFLQSVLGEEDIAVRYRGDEFAAIIPDANEEKLLAIANELKETFKEIDISNIIKQEGFKITVSIGMAIYPDNAKTCKELIGAAYQKMFLARENGGNRIITA